MAEDTYAELTLNLIEEGALERDVNDQLRTAAKALLKNLRTFDNQDAKAEVSIKITLKSAPDPKGLVRRKGQITDSFSVRTAIKTTLPGRPDCLTLAIRDGDEILTRKSGTTEDDPRQTVLATQDGRAVIDGTPQNNGPRIKENIGR